MNKNMAIPYLSVIIPTHRRAPLLTRALTSINAQHARAEIEVVVVSDVVDSATDAVCHDLLGANDIYVRRSGVPGPSSSRNIGMTLARGHHIMFLDDDDSWSPSFMASLAAFANFSLLESVYFNCTVVKESRSEFGAIRIGESFLDLAGRLTESVFVKNQIHMSCFLFSRTLLRDLEFDCSMRAYEDWDFLLATFERKMAVHIPMICSHVHEVDDHTTDRRGSSADATNFNAVIDYLYVYRRHPSPNEAIRRQRKDLLDSVSLNLPEQLL